MSKQLPIIRRTVEFVTAKCRGKGAPVPVASKVPRTVVRVPVPADADVLQDEDGFALLDEQAGQQIFDDYRA